MIAQYFRTLIACTSRTAVACNGSAKNASSSHSYSPCIHFLYSRFMQRLYLITLLINLFLAAPAFSQHGKYDCDLPNVLTIYTKTEVYITMRDGVKLFTSFYVPKDTTEDHPILFYRTPYNSEPNGPDMINWLLDCRYINEKYILAFQDVRGKYMSEGEFEDVRPFNPDKRTSRDTDEASDTYDAVDWLVKNVPHNNGRVGVHGISYPGFYSTMAILSGHPAIKAVSPQAPCINWFIGDDFHHNGAMFIQDAFQFYYSFGVPRHRISREWPRNFEMPVQDSYQFYLEEGPIADLKRNYFDDSIKFFNNAYAHPNYDEFWKKRDPSGYLVNVGPAVLTIGGWFDAEDLYGTLHNYQAIEQQNPARHPNFLLMGPWSHGQWDWDKSVNVGNIYWGQETQETFLDLELAFFNYYLLGKGDGHFSEATVFITGENQWRMFDTWPPANVKEKNLYLQPGGKAGFNPPATSSGFDEYLSDPAKPVPYTEEITSDRTTEYMTDDQRFASKRPDVLVFQTDTLTEDITFVGPMTAKLFVSTTGTDADYVVKLIDVFPDYALSNPEQRKHDVKMGGYQMLVRGEVMRGKYRNDFEKPEPFIPNQISTVEFQMQDIAHTFKKGHRIMVQVQSSWFPLVDMNPQKFTDIYTCTEADFQKEWQRIYHDREHPSNIRVMVLQ